VGGFKGLFENVLVVLAGGMHHYVISQDSGYGLEFSHVEDPGAEEVSDEHH
jgi:hypothetical protein